ncbi:MAG: hypothetical protein HY326_13035 [Chloroflexi bacterium]|nr:hypothetical protein [Chloroflexota bacterium]
MLHTTAVVQPVVQVSQQSKHLVQAIREALADLAELPPYEEDPELYTDWGEEEEFKVEVGRGECAQ